MNAKSVFASVLALAFVGAGCAQAQRIDFQEGLIMHSCAPYDGAALEARIPVAATEQVVIVRINEALGSGAMRKSMTGLGKPGGASTQLCEKGERDPKYPDLPMVKYPTCTDAVSGTVVIGALSGSRVTGSVDVTFRDGRRIVGDFGATLLQASKNQRC